jgi:hypothetical protein
MSEGVGSVPGPRALFVAVLRAHTQPVLPAGASGS